MYGQVIIIDGGWVSSDDDQSNYEPVSQREVSSYAKKQEYKLQMFLNFQVIMTTFTCKILYLA